MTNYIQAIKSGPGSTFHREATDLISKFDTDASVGDDGVVRWNSNYRVPPTEILELWQFDGGPLFDMEASRIAQEEDLQLFLADYRANDAGPTDEDRAEARAAFGPGQEIVNVITGRSYTT